MPKMKSNGSAKKRFKLTGSGEFKRKKAYASHILTKKTQKRKRNLRKSALINSANMSAVKKMLAMG
ncbi:MAG: 50S ribosomal protein L35 [Bacteroidetes bacterium]|nr:50S ribosomal protein L35 [Bacteroidota bacterium]MBR3091026.1 50S ribosomal protein L35 [Bacteroidota bacterium]